MVEATKPCRICGTKKPLSEYYRHPRTRDRHQSECKVCRRKINPKYVRAHDKKFPQRAAARRLIGEALRSGLLIKSPYCYECGEKRPTFGHHKNYDNPLAVSWLCRPCHTSHHKANG